MYRRNILVSPLLHVTKTDSIYDSPQRLIFSSLTKPNRGATNDKFYKLASDYRPLVNKTTELAKSDFNVCSFV